MTHFRYLDRITGLFVAVLIISNIASVKVVTVGPFTFDEHMGISGLEIALVPGGAIEGRLLLPVGESAVWVQR